ncbi:MAG: hypothetical protein KY475_23275, partial [Planctomycetes bacterium]|nr:hypothetical protein [Planctomycetota bacterium]
RRGRGESLGEREAARQERIQKLKDMVSQGSYQQRLVAVKALSRSGDFDQVPLLLYAMTDPDQRIVAAADEGLRFISRKFDGLGTLGDPEEVEKTRGQWTDWYLSIRPEGELLE